MVKARELNHQTCLEDIGVRLTYECDFLTKTDDKENYLRLKPGNNEREVFSKCNKINY